MRRNHVLNSTRGFTLLEVVVAASIFAGLILVISQVIILSTQASLKNSVLAGRNQLAALIRKTVSERQAIITSLKLKDNDGNRKNPLLHACVCGGAGTLCETLPYDSAPPTLILLDASGSPLTTSDGSPSGYYDANGNACPSAGPECVFKVSASLIAECRPNLEIGNSDPPLTCHGQPAEFLMIRFQIEDHQANPNANLKPIAGSSFVSTSAINPTAAECL